MDPFPFTAAEWEKVDEAASAVTNAALADDDTLEASQKTELLFVLEELRTRYGEHPILLETEADFQNDPLQQLVSYRAALKLAEKHRLPTMSIRLSLAGVLLEDLGDSVAAAEELAACRLEVGPEADNGEREEWSRLWRQCGK